MWAGGGGMVDNLFKPKNNPLPKLDEFIQADFSNYESPISVFLNEQCRSHQQRVKDVLEDAVLREVFTVGVHVDREELFKALKYDRDQYGKGYADGTIAAAPKWISTNTPPKFTSDYLVYVWVSYPDGISGMEMRTAIYNTVRKEWTVNHDRLEAIGCPSHWMTMPNPPEDS